MITFRSDWSHELGTSRAAVTDGGRWANYEEYNHGDGTQLLSVVDIDGRRALKILQRGHDAAKPINYAANVWNATNVPVSTDYTLTFSIRNDDTSPADDHTVTPDVFKYTGLTYVKRWNTQTDWTFSIDMLGLPTGPETPYPLKHWFPTVRLQRGRFYRCEYIVRFVDPSHIRVSPFIYGDAGGMLASPGTFQQTNYMTSGTPFQKRDDWTLAKYYQAGLSFPVDPVPLQTIGLGNNGQQAAVDTGQSWYIADLTIDTPGPTPAPLPTPPVAQTLPPGTYRAGNAVIIVT